MKNFTYKYIESQINPGKKVLFAVELNLVVNSDEHISIWCPWLEWKENLYAPFQRYILSSSFDWTFVWTYL